jgi:hypothetical protein
MGWQDDPVAETGAAAWQADPVAEPGQSFGAGLVRQAAQGLTLGGADEAEAFIRSLAGADYESELARIRKLNRQFEEENPGTALAANIAGSLPTLAVPGGAVARGATLAARALQGAKVGAAYGGTAGFLSGEGGAENRLASAAIGTGIGAGIGAAAPAAIEGGMRAAQPVADYIGPKIERIRATREARRAAAERAAAPRSLSAGADEGGAGFPSPELAGAEAEAEQMLANQLMRAGRTADDLAAEYAAADEATRLHSSGRAQNMLALVDLDPSLQRLASSAARQHPEVANTALNFVGTRQTGVTPTRPLPLSSGLPHRPPFGDPVTGREAQKQFGQSFRTPADKEVPMGQGERVKDALRRALLIEDEQFHGHAATASRTDDQIVRAAQQEARDAYAVAYKAGHDADLGAVVNPVYAKWAERAAEQGGTLGREIADAIALFREATDRVGGKTVGSLERFDLAKRTFDEHIERLLKNERRRYTAGVLTELKNELLAAVDRIGGNTNAGALYRAARDRFSSRMEAREALQAGREALKEGPEAALDRYRAIQGEGDRKLFRLGLYGYFDDAISRAKRSADITQLFETPQVQQLLREVIPRPRTPTGRVRQGAEFSDRPQRFGRILQSEKQMIATRNEVLGNSKTQQRALDDQAFASLHDIVQQMRQGTSGGPTAVAMQAVIGVLDKFFGTRAETAAAMASRLFSADPRVVEETLQRIARRMGPTRTEHLARILEAIHRGGTAPAANVITNQAVSP